MVLLRLIEALLDDSLVSTLSHPFFKQFIASHFTEIYEITGASVFENFKIGSLFLEVLSPEQIIKPHKTSKELSILNAIVKYSEVTLIWKYLEKVIPEDTPIEVLKERMEVILQKDSNGLSITDYAIFKRKYIVTEFIGGVLNRISGGEEGAIIQYPKMVQICSSFSKKTSFVLDIESDIIATSKNKMKEILSFLKNATIECSTVIDCYSSYITDEASKKIDAIQESITSKFAHKTQYLDITELGFDYNVVEDDYSFDLMIEHIKKYNLLGIDVEYSTLPSQDTATKEEKAIKQVSACIQLSTIDRSFLVDSLKLQHRIISGLKPVLEDSSKLKILHSCEGDVKVLYYSFGIILTNIFDTAKADMFLKNSRDTSSLATLSKELYAVHLDKTFQVTSWRVRPLPLPMIKYGISDSLVLLPIFKSLLKKMKEHSEEGAERMVWARSNHLEKWIKVCGLSVEYQGVEN